jgi:hypothetical protein
MGMKRRPATWLRTGPVPEPREWMRSDPGYDQPGPIRRDDWTWSLIGEAIAAAVILFVLIVLASVQG